MQDGRKKKDEPLRSQGKQKKESKPWGAQVCLWFEMLRVYGRVQGLGGGDEPPPRDGRTPKGLDSYSTRSQKGVDEAWV